MAGYGVNPGTDIVNSSGSDPNKVALSKAQDNFFNQWLRQNDLASTATREELKRLFDTLITKLSQAGVGDNELGGSENTQLLNKVMELAKNRAEEDEARKTLAEALKNAASHIVELTKTIDELKITAEGLTQEERAALEEKIKTLEAEKAESQLQVGNRTDLKLKDYDAEKDANIIERVIKGLTVEQQQNAYIKAGYQEQLTNAVNNRDIEAVKYWKEMLDKMDDAEKDKKAKEDENKKVEDLHKANMKKAIDDAVKLLKNLGDTTAKNLETIANSRSKVMTRLFGSDTGSNYEGLLNNVNRYFSALGTISNETLVSNINKLAEQGVAYNLEQRAFLQTVSDDIASTFDAFNGNLLRIIRIQQEDSTAARLGMEAAVTKYLNSAFNNSEYMGSSTSKGIAGTLQEAEALMTTAGAAEFEFQVLKWLGSLYSVGVSDSTVSSIAQAINKLGSGNVTGLSGSAQALLAMSANNAELDYSELLIKGLNGSDTNKLLGAMVQYLKSIASDNNVIANAYGGVFGLNVSDFSALSNLDTSMLSDISGYNYNYAGMVNNTADMYGSINERLGGAKVIENLIGNLQYSAALGISQSSAMSSIFLILNKVGNSGYLDFSILNPSVVGNALGFNSIKISDILKTTLGGISMIASAIGAGASIGNNIGMSGQAFIDTWMLGEASNTLGTGLSTDVNQTLTGSSKRSVAAGASGDISKGATASTVLDTAETQGVEPNEDDTKLIDLLNTLLGKSDGIYKALFIDNKTVNVNVSNIKTIVDRLRDSIIGGEEDANLSELYGSVTSLLEAIRVNTDTSLLSRAMPSEGGIF